MRLLSDLRIIANSFFVLFTMLTIQVETSGVKLGLVEAEELRVELVVPELAREMDLVCERLRRQLTVEQVAQLESVQAVRAMFRAWGLDPARYRPSSEALLRRVVQGKGLYRVSSVVDIANLGSVETGWPYGCYDRTKLEPPVVFRLGAPGESYEAIGKQTWHLAGRPVLVDSCGPFGSPISDSTHAMITEATRSVLTVIYAPAASPHAALRQALERHALLLSRFAGAHATEIAVIEHKMSFR